MREDVKSPRGTREIFAKSCLIGSDGPPLDIRSDSAHEGSVGETSRL